MSEQELNSIITQKLNYYMELNGTTQMELAEYMGVSQATVSNWQLGIKTPRMSKIDKICKFFNIKRSDLMEDNPESNTTAVSSLFSKEEEDIINAYRKADDIDKAIVLRTLHLDEKDTGEKNKLA